MTLRIRWFLCVLSAAVALSAVGCESMNGNAEDEEKIARRERNQRARERERELDRDLNLDRDRDRDRPDSVISRDPEPRDRRDTGRVGERRRAGMDEIPRGAVAVEGGEGEGLRYEPSSDGTIYVYDVDEDRVVYVGRVQARERFVLDPSGNRATIDGKTVFRSDLNPRNRYRLYFDRSGR